MSKPIEKSEKGSGLIFLLLLLAVVASGCLKATRPNLPRVFPPGAAPRGKNPVIVIPGILGSQLVKEQTRKQVWPGLFNSDEESLALPISSTNLAENTDDIVATEILETARLASFLPEISVYDSLLLALERYGGYRRGRLDAPEADGDRDTFYVFAYDWRRDNVESAHLLARKITALKQQLGRPELRFDIVAHSMGGLIARYYAMYGERDVLDQSEPRPSWSGAENLRRLVMIGTPNAGSMDALRTLLRGYSVTETNRPLIGLIGKLGREVAFTLPSVYQLLPHRDKARFLNAELAPIKLDLFDLETWRRFGWSIVFEEKFSERQRRSLIKRMGPEAGRAQAERTQTERERFLQAALQRAAAFHRALNAASVPPDWLHLYLFGGDCEPTLDAALIITGKGKQQTLFRSNQAPGGRLSRRRAFEAMFVPGDGRVTRHSLFSLPREFEPKLAGARAGQTYLQAIFSCELHGELPLNLTLQDNLLTALLGNRY